MNPHKLRFSFHVKKFNYCKFAAAYYVGDSGVTVIMAASQAVDPGSTPGCRTRSFFENITHLNFYGLFFSISPA